MYIALYSISPVDASSPETLSQRLFKLLSVIDVEDFAPPIDNAGSVLAEPPDKR